MKDIPRVDFYQEQIERCRLQVGVFKRISLEGELATVFEKPSAVFNEQPVFSELRVVNDAGQACHGFPIGLAVALHEELSRVGAVEDMVGRSE